MSEYKIKVILANASRAEFVVANSTITPATVPAIYTDTEYGVITRLLTELVPALVEANVKSVEIERED